MLETWEGLRAAEIIPKSQVVAVERQAAAVARSGVEVEFQLVESVT